MPTHKTAQAFQFNFMSQFLGTHQNRLDAKGRVSVPAAFRAALRDAAGGVRLILRPSHTLPCIEAWPEAVFSRLAAPLANLELFGQDQEDMATALYADACELEPDKEGRVLLPEGLARHAGLGDAVVFMGLGRMFQIWEPAAAAARRAAVQQRSLAGRMTLPGTAQAGA